MKIKNVLILMSFAGFLTFNNVALSENEAKVENNKIENTINNKKENLRKKDFVIFKDGTSISEELIKSELEKLPEQLASRMSILEAKSFIALKETCDKIINKLAKAQGIDKKQEVLDMVKQRTATACGFMYLAKKSETMMTTDALKKHYDKIWDENFKGTKEVSLVAVTTKNEKLAKKIKSEFKDEESLRKFVSENSNEVKSIDVEKKPQAILPPEISKSVLEGENKLIGPFAASGNYMLFYVKEISDAKKQKFDEAFEKNYKNVAARDFEKDYMKSLYKKYDVKITDFDGNIVDPFEIIGANKNKTATKKSKKPNSSMTFATLKGAVVTQKDVFDFYKVKSLEDESFVAMAQQFKLSTKDVITYAVKLIVDNKILTMEVEKEGFDKQTDVQEKVSGIYNMEIRHAYFADIAKGVTQEKIKKVFDDFMNAIPEEDKNDNELAVKLAFFSTKEDAQQSLKSINDGEEKFNAVYEKNTKTKSAADLGYIKKQAVPEKLWELIKKASNGTCCNETIEIDGSQFGIENKNFAIVYVLNRRPVTLPSLKNPEEKKYFKKLAEKEMAIDEVYNQIQANVKSIDGKSVEELLKNKEQIKKMIAFIIGFAS